jgi:hypothetical protein
MADVATLKRALLIVALYAICAVRCEAQFIGYVSPQTVQQTLASNVTCTGAQQTFFPSNLGQTQHLADVIFFSGTPQKSLVEIDGVDVNGTVFRISDVLTNSNGVLSASGYFPKIQISVTCSPGAVSFTLSYSGASSTASVPVGGYLLAQADKFLWSGVAGNTSPLSSSIATPYASTAGTVILLWASSPAVGTLTIQCNNNGTGTGSTFVFSTASTTTAQAFPIPAVGCTAVTGSLSSAGTGNTSLEYIFLPPGSILQAEFGTHITTTTATAVKATAGLLHTLTINNQAAGTVSIFDLPTASCTGTPATNILAVITATGASGSLPSFVYDMNTVQGICVKASVAMDLTVTAQ